MVRAYYQLAKPGIIYGNLITATAGFLLASQNNINWWLLAATLGGLSLVIGSACAFNNYIDRDLDALMARTRKRALVSGLIGIRGAIIYASIMAIAGVAVLEVFTNLLTTSMAFAAFIFYVVFYGLAKRRSIHGTVVGSLPGATPPVIGYCAVTNHLDGGALILFLILVFWQMPHFYAIAMYRVEDYKAAKLPVLPIKKGFFMTKLQILAYIVAFIAATAALTLFGYTGGAYLVVVGLVGLAWLSLGIQGFRAVNDRLWARKMFFFSLIVNVVLAVTISVNSLLIII